LKTGPIKIVVTDLVLVVFGYYVLQDLDWRSGFASSRGFSSSTAYSFLTRSFAMTGQGSVLRSPPTLDWIQVVVALLIIVNLVYAFDALKGARGSAEPSTFSPATNTIGS
jgi:hypothetical protein